MNEIPSEIDGAGVLEIADVRTNCTPTGATRHTVAGVEIARPDFLAICSYSDDKGFYLFYCDSSWSPLSDTWHETVEVAKQQADLEFSGVSKLWKQI